MKFCVLLLAFSGLAPVWAGARYQLAYQVKANSLIRAVAAAAELTKWNSEGEDVVLEGAKLFVKGQKSGFILDAQKNELILLDHETKTFERTTPAELKRRIAADFPPGVEGILQMMYPAEGTPKTEVKIESLRAAGEGEMEALGEFRRRFGLVYIMPGVDTIVSFTPHLERRIAQLGREAQTPQALRFAIGKEGRILEATVEIKNYREEKIDPSLFLPPPSYRDAAQPPNI